MLDNLSLAPFHSFTHVALFHSFTHVAPFHSCVIGATVHRRYLTLSEAESALNRGKSIECFVGSCERDGQRGIKWLSASRCGENLRLAIFETADLGSADFLDLHEFGPMNPALEPDEPDEEKMFENFRSLVSEVEALFPGSTARFVNEGIIQDEYSDFIARGRK